VESPLKLLIKCVDLQEENKEINCEMFVNTVISCNNKKD